VGKGHQDSGPTLHRCCTTLSRGELDPVGIQRSKANSPCRFAPFTIVAIIALSLNLAACGNNDQRHEKPREKVVEKASVPKKTSIPTLPPQPPDNPCMDNINSNGVADYCIVKITGCIYDSDTQATITGTITNLDKVKESYLILAGGYGSFSIASGNVTVSNVSPGETVPWTVEAEQPGGGLAPGPMNNCLIDEVLVAGSS